MEQKPAAVKRILAILGVAVLPFIMTYAIYTGIGIITALTKDAPTDGQDGIYALGATTAGIFAAICFGAALFAIIALVFAVRYLSKDKKPQV